MAVDGDVTGRTEKICYQFSEVALQLVNEPSLGLYRVNEHISRTVPRIRECDKKLNSSLNKMNGCTFDIEYDSDAMRSITRINQFESISSEISRAIVLQKKLNERKGDSFSGSKSEVVQRVQSRDYGSTWSGSGGKLRIN